MTRPNGCLGYVQGITSSLQAEAKDIGQAVQEIDVVLASLNDVRKNINDHHQEWHEEIEKMCVVVDMKPSLPRRCGRQRHRDNVLVEDPVT